MPSSLFWALLILIYEQRHCTQFIELSGNFRLLECLLRTKEALAAQARYTNSLTESITQLTAEKTDLQRMLFSRDERNQFFAEHP